MLLLRDFWTFAFAVASAFALLAGMIYPYFWVHYYGPFLPMVFLLLLRGMQALWSMVRMRSKALRSSMAVLGVGIVVLSALDHYRPPDPKADYGRTIVETALTRTGQKHLVFVEYGPQHNRIKNGYITPLISTERLSSGRVSLAPSRTRLYGDTSPTVTFG